MSGNTENIDDPVVASLELIDSRWRLAVLYHLQEAEKQFEELLELVDASSEQLSAVIDDLQELGLVERRMGTESSLETDYQCSQELTGTEPGGSGALMPTYYSLTPKGASLEPVFEAVRAWGTEWVGDTEESSITTGSQR